MNKLLEMSKEELEERTKELLQIDQVDLILKYLYQEQRINKAIEYITNNFADIDYVKQVYGEEVVDEVETTIDLKNIKELLDILKGGRDE